jgi:hypothetical protein
MEADWEFEVGCDAPVIDALWSGFIDLQHSPELVWKLPEAAQFPALAEALIRLNTPGSLFWSAKCDYWPQLEAGDFDPDEMNAPPESAAHAMGCYIDLLPASEQRWSSPNLAEAACKNLCALLAATPLACCRADLLIRRAWIDAERLDLGMTAYLTACGATSAEAKQTLNFALRALADALCTHSTLE